MRRSERPGDLIVAVRAAIRGDRAGLWTSMPGALQSFDPATVSASVQPSVQVQVQDKKGVWSNVSLPILTQVPVLFPSGGGYLLTFPLAAGDEGLLVFASRCIDSWWQSGGVQKQPDLRMHDLSDGFFIPGAFSNPRAPTSPVVDNTLTQLRSLDGTRRVEMGEDYVAGYVGDGNGSRFVASSLVAKIRRGASYVVATGAAVVVSTMPVVGPDPDPH